MKQLLTLAIAFTISVSTQAAHLTWTLAQVKTPDSATTAASAGWLAYLFSTANSSVEAVSSALDSGDFDILSDAFDQTEVQGTAGLVSHKTDDVLSKGQTFEGFIVVLDSATASTAENYLITSAASKQVNQAGSDLVMAVWGMGSSYSWNEISTSPGPGPQPDIPEPATGALALAGVALLFRRRRA